LHARHGICPGWSVWRILRFFQSAIASTKLAILVVRGIEEVNRAIGQMDSMTQQNTALVEEASSAALELRDQASSLADVVGLFKLDTCESATRQSGYTPEMRLPPMRLAHS